MPLVTICGIPGAGKSWIATRLQSHFEALGKDVVLINEESEHLERNQAYLDSRAEKMTRSALKSRVQLHLSANCVVILDSLNYIKGYRYELFCLAKENSTTHCVVFVNTPVDIAQTRNVSRDSDAFPELMVEEIAQRFEIPLERNRWDAPLIRVSPDVNDDTIATVLQEIEQAIIHGKATKAGIATQAKPVAETTFLQALDAITNTVVDELVARQRDSDLVDAFTLPQATQQISFSPFSILT
ncbi:hypothetical protein LEN26_011641 [Aphanomyces euteiches]|uniref:Uncharacterized protein n=1 Tax=Aphanomyces euteiches TaxID=100861 RepID=A0A6G0XGA3_9STRA|nr:hypothetical protein Ae201684_005266 [Aphanomyces euteiches]KAH9053539.1 hypothetical protein Ae201684P_015304 [Aphanomyces euteiches]KAH9119443.1 hypothetical protein LEN26_011641 [Aphanomyces euteiches]KAH9134396.1 hypothetical protein AeRB84_019849 [Aphanomyces euteiches]KAH9183772.1 hypothetical protein AeNC1_014250 [Aphanomyces euteiches]